MAKPKSTGACRLCGARFESSKMSKHLKACRSKTEKAGRRREKLFHIAVEGADAPEYWMHLEVPARATLEDLDGFLRDTWLECCGHLSAFQVGDTQHLSRGASGSAADGGIGVALVRSLCRALSRLLLGPGTRSVSKHSKGMEAVLSELLKPGMKFGHRYDFGSTTCLALRVVGEHEGERPKEFVRVLAQNDPPEIKCESCGKPAELVCPECLCESKGWLCRKCAKKHRCGQEMMLPVVNSPRVGVCGYCGPEEDDESAEANEDEDLDDEEE